MNEKWFFTIPRLIAISIAIFLYGIALFAIVRKIKKPVSPTVGSDRSVSIRYSGPEKRIYPRAKLGIGVRYKLYGIVDGVQVFREGKVGDISEGGLLLETEERLSVGDKLEFKVRLPTISYFMLLRGNIVWVREVEKDRWYNYGISFTEIEPNDRKEIAKFVMSRQCSVG